jgi:acyl-coenzyme A synthetase/AMP-(fatty) acid ligase
LGWESLRAVFYELGSERVLVGVLTIAAWAVWALFLRALVLELVEARHVRSESLLAAGYGDAPGGGPLRTLARGLVTWLTMTVGSVGSLAGVAAAVTAPPPALVAMLPAPSVAPAEWAPGPAAPATVYEIIERYRPTLFFSVPTHYAMLLAHTRPQREFDLSSIRAAVSAGEALPPVLFERFRKRFDIEILDGIGSTEILHIFISNQPGRVRPGSSGVVVPGYEARLVDEQGHPVPSGELGDLLVRGDSTCAFYWNRHERTKDTIVGHWIRTGDKYRQDDDGFFWFAGRSDDMLKVGGIWVSPAEVEHLLLEHPAVQACGVTGREDQDGLVKPVAHVVPRPGHEAGPGLAAELQQFARQRLAEYKRPRWIEFVDALPLTATGKVQRFKLRAHTPSAS